MRISDWSSDVCSSDLLGDFFGFDRLDEVHASSPSSFAARQRQVGPERPHGAPKGPACVTVCPLPPFVSARRRSSHDPPIAALRGSCALPTSRAGYNAAIRYRKSVVYGKSVSVPGNSGGGRRIKKKT